MTRNAVDWGYFRNIEHTVGCEIRFSFKLRDGTKVVGVIDRLDVMAPRADVLDLKTQKRELDDAKLMDNWQARIYNMGARELHPEVTESVSASFWVLRHRVQRVWLHQVHADRDRDELMRIADKIRDCKEPVPSPSGLCPWCPAYAECDAAKATRR
jgi:RecB family exonuclease